MASLILPAPAKLNLFLRITGQRPDGYHLLQTGFQFLSWADVLHFRAREDKQIIFHCANASINGDDNLVVRAAKLLQKQGGATQGMEITLEKNLPIGGGLGGGSSDAATTLLALNQLWGLGYSLDALASIGLQLGADIPVFVRGQAAWAEGVGEQLTPIDWPTPWYLVIAPDCAVNTAEIFGHPELTRDSPTLTIRSNLAGIRQNDCEAVARKLAPEVDKALTWLAKQGPAYLTGTGACIYTECESEQAAKALQAKVPKSWQSFVSQGVNESPAHELLRSKL